MERNRIYFQLTKTLNIIIQGLSRYEGWAFVVFIIGIMGISGWIFSYSPVLTIFPNSKAIAPNTAILFFIFGILMALPKIIVSKFHIRLVQLILCILAYSISIWTLIDISLHYPIHIDRLIITPYIDIDDEIWHMSPVTSILFIFLFTSILYKNKNARICGYIGAIFTLIGAEMALGYIYGSPFLYEGLIIPVAFLTALGFLCSGICLVLYSNPKIFEKIEKIHPLKYKILKYYIPFIIVFLLLEGWIITYLHDKTDSTLVLTVSFITFVSILLAIFISHLFSNLISADIEKVNELRAIAENDLKDSLTRLKISGIVAGVGFWTWNFENDLLIWDDKTFEIYDLPVDKYLNIYELLPYIHPDDRPTPYQIEEMKSQEEIHTEFRIILKNGSFRYIEGHGITTYSDDGKPVRMVGMSWDITPKVKSIQVLKQQKEELAEMNEELISQDENLKNQYLQLAYAHEETLDAKRFTQEVISQAGEGIVVIDEKGEVISWNQTMTQLTGDKSEQVIGEFFLEKYPFLKDLGFESYISQAMQGTIINIPDSQHIIPQLEKTIWLSGIASPHKNTKGDIIGVIFTVKDITVRKEIEQKLIQSESLLQASQSLAKIGGWEWDIIQDKMFWTEEMYVIHEVDPSSIPFSSQEHIALSILCYDESDREIVMQAFNRCVSDGIPYDMEFPFTSMRGNRIWIRTLAHAEREGDRIVRIRGVIMDISQEKALIEELKKERQSLRNILDAMPDGVLMVDKNYLVRYTNPAMHTLFGDPGQRHCYEYLNNRSSPCPWCKNEQIFKGDSVKWEWEFSKTWRVYDLFDTPYLNLEGEIDKLEFFHDITDLRETEKKLSETNEYLSRLIENANVPIIVWNHQNLIQQFNYASELLSGFTKNEVIGKPFSMLFPTDNSDQIISQFSESMKKGRMYEKEIPVLRADGIEIPVIWNAAEITDKNGNILAIIAQGRNIKRERELETEKAVALKQIQRNFGELAILNDGIRNPLMIISMISEMKCPDVVEEIETQVNLINEIVTNLDNRWMESESVLKFLQKHYEISMTENFSHE